MPTPARLERVARSRADRKQSGHEREVPPRHRCGIMAYVRETAWLRRLHEAIQMASDGLLRRLAVAYGFGCVIGLALILTHTVSLDWFALLYWPTSLALCVPITVRAAAAYRRRKAEEVARTEADSQAWLDLERRYSEREP